MKSAQQDRWDGYGKERLESALDAPEQFRIGNFPGAQIPIRRDFLKLLGNLRGRKVLDLGCGSGETSIWYAQQGADVSAVDIGPALIEAAKVMAEINDVRCEFRQGDIAALPFEDNQFDLVTGLAILHHLSEDDVRRAIGECLRVLKPNGRALFQEPVENSPTFDFLQNLLPAGGKESRPSILARARWKEYLARRDDRVMSDAELRSAGIGFSRVDIRHYGLFVRLIRIFGHRYRQQLTDFDEWIIKAIPWIGRYSQSSLVTYTK